MPDNSAQTRHFADAVYYLLSQRERDVKLDKRRRAKLARRSRPVAVHDATDDGFHHARAHEETMGSQAMRKQR